MAIEAGTQLLHYRLIEKIGEGGMGVVWRATDTTLDRDVAIKLLPEALAADAERLARFEREAKLLAALSHPNIASIYGLHAAETDAGTSRFIAMELVAGDDLAERLVRGPVSIDQAIDLCRQVAEGLEAAHAAGIIHRDLKPANIKVTPDGKVKVLDFGLAKGASAEPAPSADPSITPTMTHDETRAGMVMGTAAYMSPEQARAKPLDARTDVWSFGCVLYECLVGARSFGGETANDSISKILQLEPDWDALPPPTPPRAIELLRRCLKKDANERLDNMADARIALEQASVEPVPTAARTADRKGLYLLGAVGAVAVLALAAYFAFFRGGEATPRAATDDRTMLAVLPFENLGQVEDEYFADGMTEEIGARLAGIRGFGVIARTSTAQYKGTTKSVAEIGEELGIEYVLQGTVRWQQSSDGASRVRVTPELIRVADSTSVWANVYHKAITDIFEVQSDIAGRVADALDVALLESERKSLETRPTDSLEAYDFYLRGKDYLSRGYSDRDFQLAYQMLEQAIEHDPGFAEAHAQLAIVHDNLYWFYYDRTPERLARAKAAIDQALALDPDLPSAHLALGWYYYHGFLDYERALEQFAIAQAGRPQDPYVLTAIAAVSRRQGNWENALREFKAVLELDPRTASRAEDVAETAHAMRRFDETERYYDRSIFLDPDVSTSYIGKAWLQLSRDGDTTRARVILEDAEGTTLKDNPLFGTLDFAWATLEMLDGNASAALDRLPRERSAVVKDNQFSFVPAALLRAQIHALAGRADLARSEYESARAVIEDQLRARPEDARLYSALGLAYAGLGQKVEAIRAGTRATELLPVAQEAWRGAYHVADLAQINATVGEHATAIDQLAYLLSIPGELTPSLLRIDPTWKPLRDKPRYREMLGESQDR